MINKFNNYIGERNRTIIDFESLVSKSDKSNINEEPNTFTWGCSVIKHSDGLYYSFITKWTNTDGLQGWLLYMSIYVSDGSVSPLGGFENYTEITSLKTQSWSANIAGNPKVIFNEGLYYLYYTGSYYNDPSESIDNQRIGVATSTHPKGDWIPEPTNPILEPRADNWDTRIAVNPAIWKAKDGVWRMAYKSFLSGSETRAIGIVQSTDLINWSGKSDSPNFSPDLNGASVEDPDVWQEGDKWYALLVDVRGDVVDYRNGIFMISNDGVNFYISPNQPSWNENIKWTDGTTSSYQRQERPFVLVEKGVGTVFYSVCNNNDIDSFNIGRPIKFK